MLKNHNTSYPFASKQYKMWLLLITSVISTFGGAHGLFGKLGPGNPEANMNIVSNIWVLLGLDSGWV